MQGMISPIIIVLYGFLYAHAFDPKYFDDGTFFRITTNKWDLLNNLLEDAETKPQLIPIVTADDEKYYCRLPTIQAPGKTQTEEYSGPSPDELISQLYGDEFCSQKVEPFWAYELCHGRYFRQFHQPKEGPVLEYFLGNFAEVKSKNDFNNVAPPSRDFDGTGMRPFYSVTYEHGTNCDLTNVPRKTIVYYICSMDAVRTLTSVTEVKTCVYEAVVAVKELCDHPAFKLEEPKEHEIQCFTKELEDNPKPKSMRKFENEVKTKPMLPLKADQTGPISQRVPPQKASNEIYNLFNTKENLKMIKEIKNLIEAARKPKNSAPSSELLTSFWNGEACLFGGAGYWKYEFCYQRSVSQYHDEPDGESQKVVLGYFDEKLHKEWVSETGTPAVKMDGDYVQQISNMYSRGDLCKEMNSLRNCEVRLTCRQVKDPSEDPKAINMYLVEPQTCSYVLLVESQLFCDKIQHVDEYGLFSLNDASSAEYETAEETN